MSETCLQLLLLINCYFLLNVNIEEGCLYKDKKKMIWRIVLKCTFK